VHTDQKRLRQILINLLSNAIKYTERGHASLSLSYRSQVAEFEISDSGVGIASQDLERVFEPFERGSMPASRSIPGVGLGLTITKLLTQIMGGEIRVRSTPGEGTTFTVKLLLSNAANYAPAPAVRRPITGYAGRAIKILLIDDDPHHVDIVQGLLRPLGFVVFIAQGGRAGLALAAECQPDLAMIDLSMPDMTGWEVAKELRARADFARTPIVIVSANAHEHSPGGEGSVHDAFIIKPVEMQLLLDCIGTLLGLEWLHESPPGTPDGDASVGVLPEHSRHHLDDLYQLGRIGHVRGIQAKLQEIAAEDPANEPFAKHLRQLVANFDLKRYMNVLEAMRNDG
jgi:CheY-like chemotaxis protein/anti-sigma regulatory factor (Ser/Thr protein kinase)